MIKGIGVDLVKINRLESIYKKYNERLIKRILTDNEQLIFFGFKDFNKARFLAKRFAAKEAFAKALGTGIGKTLSFNEIEIYNNEHGKPMINIISSKGEKFKNYKHNLSISDENDYAVAFVVIE